MFPRTFQCSLQANERCDQDIQLSRFDFLDGPDIQISEFCEFLLRDLPGASFASDIRAEAAQLPRKRD
jgi:hypothetical protein